MRELQWPPARDGAELLIDRPRLAARRLGGLGQTLISGDLDAAVAALAPGAPMLGLYALAPESAHALRIGRTSALLVTPAPLAPHEGWRDGWCATSADDGWAAVEVSGADAGRLPPPCRGAAARDAHRLARRRRTCSVCVGQGEAGDHFRLSRMSALARMRSFLMMATMATLAGLPALIMA